LKPWHFLKKYINKQVKHFNFISNTRILPRISIITSSFNQGCYIEQTIKSVIAQNYLNYEHIIVDNMSTDETPHILAKYPHLIVIREPDKGQANAINKGFAIATGDIFCFLNSDDTFKPDTFHRIALEIDPQKGHYIVMGRCLFMRENNDILHIEHPSYFVNHQRLLKIWKGHGIPQPAVFWSKEVYLRYGGLDENEQWVLDYDLFCRYSQHYHFHFINQIFAYYRLHTAAKTSLINDEIRLKKSIEISKKYWRKPFSAFYLQLAFSLINAKRISKTRTYLKKDSQPLQKLIGLLLGLDVIYFAKCHTRLKPIFKNPTSPQKLLSQYPQVMAYLNYQQVWDDHWVGPHLTKIMEVTSPVQQFQLQGEFQFLKSLELTIYINQQKIAAYTIHQKSFLIDLILKEPLNTGKHSIQIHTDKWFIMHDYCRNNDFRPLSFRVKNLLLINKLEMKEDSGI